MGKILAILTHRSPLSRVLGGVAVAFVLWLSAWAVSYQVLSEGVLTQVMSARIPDDVLRAGPTLAFSIFGWNLLFGVGAIVAGSFFAIGPISLGYFAPWWWSLGYGGTTTANELHIPVRTRVDVTGTSADEVRNWASRLAAELQSSPVLRNVVSEAQDNGLRLNVDVDREMTTLAESNVMYDAMAQLTSSKLAIVRSTLQDMRP